MTTTKIIFILSAPRSGSTLLELILSSHPKVFGLGELNQLYKVFDNKQKDESPTPLCDFCTQDCEYWDHRFSAQVLKEYFHQESRFTKIRGLLNAKKPSIYKHFFEWTGSEILVDNSKSSGWVESQLSYDFGKSIKIAPVIIFLTRDGRAVANSVFRKYPERNFEDVVANWQKKITNLNDYYCNFPENRRLKISYENLAMQPDKTVSGICDFLEIENFPEMLLFWEYDHHAHAGNFGPRFMVHKYRSKSATDEIKEGKSPEHFKKRKEHYDSLGFTIKLDTRWKDELTNNQIQTFERIAGTTNQEICLS